MERRIFIFLGFFAVRALSQATYKWVNIDCGTETNYEDRYGLQWVTDEEFILTGKNKQVSSSVVVLEQMESLRFFTEQNKNCYSTPTSTGVRYFIRAAFFYGNYDGISNPPTFDLEFDGNKWVTVVTSITETVYHEVIYMAKRDNISVCVTRTRDNEFPFISSLETWPLPKEMYAGMDRNFAWLKSYRYRYGGTDTIWYPDDSYKRIWDPSNPSGLIPVTADFTSLILTTVDHPPEKGLLKAVVAENPTDSINLEFPFPNSNRFNFLSIDYAEMTELELNDTRSFGFVVDGQDLNFIASPSYQTCSGIGWKTKSSGTLTVDLIPTGASTLPPIISLIEVYSASDPLITTGTSLDDLNGLDTFISSFKKLQGWSGEPCLPSDTVWQWLNCSGDDPPRITSINLSGYGLDGPLPQFDQMQALESIDLSNNSIDGPIPDFLGNLPKLTKLNLGNNNFSGKIPESLTKNKKISLNVKGNSLLPHKKNNLALKIGLSVGIPLGLVLVLIVVISYLIWKRRRASQAVTTTGEGEAQARPQGEDVTISVSAEEGTKPSSNGQSIPVSTNPGVPSMNSVELNELIHHHASVGVNGVPRAGPP